jgi:hypothetical protein
MNWRLGWLSVIGIDWRKRLNKILEPWGFMLVQYQEMKSVIDLIQAYDTFARGQLESHQELYMDREAKSVEIVTIH